MKSKSYGKNDPVPSNKFTVASFDAAENWATRAAANENSKLLRCALLTSE